MYKVLIDTLNHNGRKRVPGELIDMSDADAAPLIKIGAIEAAAATVNPPDPGPGDDPEQPPNPAPTDNADASQTDVQQQPDVSASTNNDAGSGAPKTDNKANKSKAK